MNHEFLIFKLMLCLSLSTMVQVFVEGVSSHPLKDLRRLQQVYVYPSIPEKYFLFACNLHRKMRFSDNILGSGTQRTKRMSHMLEQDEAHKCYLKIYFFLMQSDASISLRMILKVKLTDIFQMISSCFWLNVILGVLTDT